uniref:Uncharacterized protein n=1 Tax=Rhizobium rhizogenes TaxID=359 RepID=A0A7S4ZT19_RHIRH|nr:hypothetical protein pC6.5b_448 [Rhizobium rhizogenes]QCL10497.1 hypothetical protein pC6.5c_604 [Rhizobium rhizogenes]
MGYFVRLISIRFCHSLSNAPVPWLDVETCLSCDNDFYIGNDKAT